MSLPTIGARGARRVEHRGAPRIDRNRDVEAGVQRLDRGHDPIELFGLADLRAGPGLHAPDIEQIGAVATSCSARRKNASNDQVAPRS